MQKVYKNPGPITFTATIEQSDTMGEAAWVIFPYDLKETYGVGNLVPMKVTFDDKYEYRGSIAKMGPEPMILLRNDIRAQIGKARGDTLKVKVELDDKPREVEIPDILKKFFRQHTKAKETFDKLAYTHRKEYVEWISSAKQDETRERRLVKMLEMLTKDK